jgi:hypothetical protein
MPGLKSMFNKNLRSGLVNCRGKKLDIACN